MFSNLHFKNETAWLRILRVSVVVLLACASLPHASAQHPQIDALAANVAKELNKKHEETVIVFDFADPDKKFTALGQKSTDDFTESLKKSTPVVSVAGRA